MRKIDKIIVHCTAGNQKNNAWDVVRFHTMAKALGGLGWKTAGYHYVVEADGTVVNTVAEERVSNGVAGHNAHAIHVCYTGGVDLNCPGYPPTDNRTEAQRKALRSLLGDLKHRYPQAGIYGHRDFNRAKACPSFDARKEYADIKGV